MRVWFCVCCCLMLTVGSGRAQQARLEELQGFEKIVMLGVVWLYAHHFFAGIRYLLLDLHIGIGKEPSRKSALAVLAAGLAATLLVGWRLW